MEKAGNSSTSNRSLGGFEGAEFSFKEILLEMVELHSARYI